MKKAKVFLNGGSQAVRLLKEHRFSSDEVCITKVRDVVMIFPPERGWEALERAGGVIGPMDLLGAAHAVAEGAVLVTNNEREFRHVAGLRVANWL